LCEQDHILPDYRNRFIPTLADFIHALQIGNIDPKELVEFSKPYRKNKELMNLILSPLHITGLKVSLLVTHNSWFINEIVPKVMKKDVEIRDFSLSPATLFENMKFQLWMDNGNATPPIARLTRGKVVSRK